MADAYGVEDALEGNLFAAIYAGEEVVAGFLLPAIQRHELLFGEFVEVAELTDVSQIVELLYGGVARQDVHCVTAYEMHERRLYLGGASGAVGTVVTRLVVVPDQRGAAVGAESGEVGPGGIGRAFLELDGGDFGNNLAALFYIYPVADADVQQRMASTWDWPRCPGC